MMVIYEGSVAFILGTAIGSFLNVCIYRLPRNASVVFPGSRCPLCACPIRWHDNVPLLSFVLLRGRCRACGGRISLLYPLVEAMTGALFVLLYGHFDLSVDLIPALILTCVLIVASCTDLQHGLIPNGLSAFLVAAGIGLSFVFGMAGFYQGLLGGTVGGGALFLIGALGKQVFHRDSMGGGDIKMAAGIGLFLGWRGMLNSLVLACIIGTCVGLGHRILGRLQPYAPIPFAPFLSLGAWIELFFTPVLL